MENVFGIRPQRAWNGGIEILDGEAGFGLESEKNQEKRSLELTKES